MTHDHEGFLQNGCNIKLGVSSENYILNDH